MLLHACLVFLSLHLIPATAKSTANSVTAVTSHVDITDLAITLPASATITSLPTVDGKAPLFHLATANTTVASSFFAPGTYIYQSASYVSPTSTCVTAIPTTTMSGGKASSTQTKPYCAITTIGTDPALACAPQVEDLVGDLWLKGSFDSVTAQPAAATIITNAWSASPHLNKRGLETGAVAAIQAIALLVATAVVAGRSYQNMFGHGPVWVFRPHNAAAPVSSVKPIPTTSTTSTTSCAACQTCIKNLTPLVPTREYILVPVTAPAQSTQTSTAAPVQTSYLGCLKDTTEDPEKMYFYRKDAANLFPGWCNDLNPQDDRLLGWGATENGTVARAGQVGSTQVRMSMGTAPNNTISTSQQADWKANCQTLLNIAMSACDEGNNKPQAMDVMYGGWVTSQGIQWRVQGQQPGTGPFKALSVNPPYNLPKKRSVARDTGVVKWAKRCWDDSKSFLSSTVTSLTTRPSHTSLSLYGFSACSQATDCASGYVAAEWTDMRSPPNICSQPLLKFHTVQTNASVATIRADISFSVSGNQQCEFTHRSRADPASTRGGNHGHGSHFTKGRQSVGEITCQTGSGASTVGTCFAPESQHSASYMCPARHSGIGSSERSGMVYKMMADCIMRS